MGVCVCMPTFFSLTLLSSLSVRVSVAVDIQTFQRASFYDNVSGLHEAPGESQGLSQISPNPSSAPIPSPYPPPPPFAPSCGGFTLLSAIRN